MAIHDSIPIGRVRGVKPEVALVANFLAARIEPGIEQGIGHGLRQLVRSHVDGAIGINVVVGSSGNSASVQAGPRIRKKRVDRVAAKGAMIATEGRERTLRLGGIKALSLILRGEDHEDVMNRGRPALHALSMGDFGLDIGVEHGIARISTSVHEASSKRGCRRSTSTCLGVLLENGVVRGSMDIAQEALYQAVIS